MDLRLEVAVVAGERWERFPVAVDVAGAAGRHFEDVHVQSPGGVPAEQAMVVVDLHAPRPEVVRQVGARVLWCAGRKQQKQNRKPSESE